MRKFEEIKNKFYKYLEKIFPIVLSIISIVILHFVNIDKINNLKDIVTNIITFASIIIGFLTTMISILITSNDKEIIVYLNSKKRLKDLYIYLVLPIIVGLILVIVCLLFMPIAECENIKNYWRFYITNFIVSYFILLCLRAIVLLILLIFDFIELENNKNNNNKDHPNYDNAFKGNKDANIN